MKIKLADLHILLQTLYLQFTQFFDETRVVLLAEAYYQKLKFYDDFIVKRVFEEWDEDKFPTAVQLARRCRNEKNKQKTNDFVIVSNEVFEIDGYIYVQAPPSVGRCEHVDRGQSCRNVGVVNTTNAWYCRKHQGEMTGHSYHAKI